MSLLDVLRYPISTPVTGEELMALPCPLIRSWMALVHWTADADLERVAIYYADSEGRKLACAADHALLRRMILDYEGIV